jgi:hypothetical protein
MTVEKRSKSIVAFVSIILALTLLKGSPPQAYITDFAGTIIEDICLCLIIEES